MMKSRVGSWAYVPSDYQVEEFINQTDGEIVNVKIETAQTPFGGFVFWAIVLYLEQ